MQAAASRRPRYARHESKDWARETLRDYFVTTTMPFTQDLEIDEPGLHQNVDRLLSLRRVGGVYVGSIYQEFTTLTLAERKRVAAIVIDAVGGRVPVMVGVSANAFGDVVELAAHATDSGADLIMIWPPLFGDRAPAGVLDFYERAVRRIGIGVCVYASGFGELGFQLTSAMLDRLADHENVCAVKEASWNLATHLRTLLRVGDRLVVSCPAEEYWWAGRRLLGPDHSPRVLLGSSRPMYLQTPKRDLTGAFLDSVEADDQATARRLFEQILTVTDELVGRQLAKGTHSVALTKAITEMLGYVGGPVRPPLTPASSDALVTARNVLTQAGLL